MNSAFPFSLSLVFAACASPSLGPGIGAQDSIADPTATTNGTDPGTAFFIRSTYTGPWKLDSTEFAHLDTSTAEQKHRWLIHRYGQEHAAASPLLLDTLMDLNYDGHPDVVLGTYGSSGTGIKYGWEVHTWNARAECYVEDTLIGRRPNPTYFPKDSVITSFYIGAGGGHGTELKWTDGRWQEIRSFEVDNDGEATRWVLYHPLTGHRDTLHLPFQMMPPKAVLRYRTEVP